MVGGVGVGVVGGEGGGGEGVKGTRGRGLEGREGEEGAWATWSQQVERGGATNPSSHLSCTRVIRVLYEGGPNTCVCYKHGTFAQLTYFTLYS